MAKKENDCVEISDLDDLTQEQAQKYLEHYSAWCPNCQHGIYEIADSIELDPPAVLIKLAKMAETDYALQCPDDERIRNFSFNFISSEEAVEVAAHLANCDGCLGVYEHKLAPEVKKKFDEIERLVLGKLETKNFIRDTYKKYILN